jgi:hypothetical protein
LKANSSSPPGTAMAVKAGSQEAGTKQKIGLNEEGNPQFIGFFEGGAELSPALGTAETIGIACEFVRHDLGQGASAVILTHDSAINPNHTREAVGRAFSSKLCKTDQLVMEATVNPSAVAGILPPFVATVTVSSYRLYCSEVFQHWQPHGLGGDCH